MESCHSVQLIPPTRLPVYSTLGHLIKIIEKLQNRDYAVPDLGDELRWLKCEKGRDTMEGNGGTGQSKQLSSVIGTLEMELRKLQQSNDSLAQENISQHQSIKALEQRLKPLNEKNRKFLEKNMELTNVNRSLKDQLQNISEENRKLKDQCEQCRKKLKQLNQQLSQERLERGTLELQAQGLQDLKLKCADQEKVMAALKLSVQEKDRRIELVQHRKRKKKVLRPQETGVKETFYGYDEEDTSLGSDISLSLSTGTISDEELCEELSRSEIEKNYQKLMKEHLELQRLHALLTSKSGTYHDPQRELKMRVDLENNLFESQREIESLTANLTDTKKKLSLVEASRSETLEEKNQLNKKVRILEETCRDLREKLEESKEMVETLEFQIMEYETDNVGGLETIPEDLVEMNGAGHTSKTGSSTNEFDVYVESLESSVRDLQSKVSSLQQENATLKERPVTASPSLEERETQEVMTLKVQYLEKAEEIASQTISDLEMQNQLLEQRLQLKEELETDIMLVETLKVQVRDLESENKELKAKVAELEENEEILKINWMKVAENDAERILSLEEKVNNLESLNVDLRKRFREQREKSDPPNAPSLALELSQSDNSLDGNTMASLQEEIKKLKEEVLETEEKKNGQIEKLQDKIATLRENEIKLSETLAEMEQMERELRSKVSMYEQMSSYDKLIQYEGKIQEMHRSREDLLDRMDSMEEHEGDLKKRLIEMEEKHEWKVKEYERKMELMEKEIAQYIQQEEDLTSRIMEIEKHEDEVMEKMNKYEEDVKVLEDQLEESESAREDLEHKKERLVEEMEELRRENQELHENLENVNEELEQMRIENNDLNERVIELDSYEQECEEKVKTVENKSNLLEEANCRLMDQVTELEGLEMELRNKLEKSTQNVYPKSSCSSEDKSTDTDDLNALTGRKLTGMFERLQDLESENQTYADQLVNLQGADVLNRKLGEKLKLLEDSEEKLMERVIELEDREDILTKENQKLRNSIMLTEVPDIVKEVSELRETIELLKASLESLRCENEEYQEKIAIAEETIQSLQSELSIQKSGLENSEMVVTELRGCLKETEDNLSKEKQCVQNLQDSEKKLSGKLEAERLHAEELENDLSKVKNSMKEKEMEYKSKLSELNESLSSHANTVSELEMTLSHSKSNEEQHSQKISELTEENNALIKLMKMKSERVNSESESESETTFVQDKAIQRKLLNQNSTPISAQSTPIKHENDPCAKAELIGDISNIIHTSDEPRCANCVKLNQKLKEKSKRESTLMENLAAVKKSLEDKEKSGKNVCSKCQSVTSNSPSISSDIDSFFGLNKTEEFNRKMRAMQEQCDEQTLRAREKALVCRVKELEDELEEFQRILRDVVLDVQIRFHDDIQEAGPEVPHTFCLPSDLPVVLNPELGKVIESLVHCVDCLSKSKEKNSNADEETAKKIKALKQSEETLKQQVLELKERLANNNNGGVEIRENSTELLTKISKLEAMNRDLRDKLESEQEVSSDGGLESPEDVFRQRISELERLEKHLKHQVSDLEKDREELHEIARKDKNTIHEQNIRIRELQLSEKNMKEQLNQLEASEQGLYNKVEDLEEQISRMEDRISELTILEMRLKELVRKYKLDEEVWLSKSANLNETLSELSTSEAQLRQQLESVEKEKLNLSEKSEYLEERLKEVEKAEANLLQRTKDQENKEISLSKRLTEMQTMGSNAEKQLAELHNANIELSQQLNHMMQENVALSHHLAQVQNQLAVLDQQNVSLHSDVEKLNKENASLQTSGKSLDKELEKCKLSEVEMEGRLRQKEESEELLKERIGNLQRSENRLKYRVQQLESGSMTTELSPSQREKLPRKLEDCQKRIVVLQNQNVQLSQRLREYQNPQGGFVKIPDTELRRLQARDALLEQSETEVREIGKLNAHLQGTVEELKEGKDTCGHEGEVDILRNRLEKSNKTILVLKSLLEEGQTSLGHDINGEILADQNLPSHMGREGKGHLAERRVKNQRSNQSNAIGRPVQELTNGVGVLNEKIISRVERSQADLLVTSSGHVVMDLYKEVQGLHENNPYSLTSQEDRQQRVNEFISCLETDELFSPREEAHWRQVESRPPLPPESERWIHVGKAQSLHSSGPNRSHPTSNEELVLGLTLPSESESHQFTQNDTDSSGNSPATKRRKFRPVNGTQPHPMAPSSNHVAPNFDAPYYLPAVNHGQGGVEEEEPGVHYMTEDYKMMSPPIRSEETTASLPDSGHGTTSVASTGRSQMSLKEKIAEIGKSLQKRPLSSVSDLTDDDEDSVHVWKSKASDSYRRLEDAEKESKHLKGEINKLEKELEEKTRYIIILEDFIEKMKTLLELKGSKSNQELVQILEAELMKTLEELQDSGCQPVDLNQDPVALNSELSRKDRELTAKANEVDGLMRELRQWQEECRLVEDMRTNALDALRCLEMEVSDLHTTGRDLRTSQESHKKLQHQCQELESEKEQIMVSVAPLKTKVARLMQRCREKDDLLRRMGAEFRRLKKGGGPGSLLQELALMEQRMPSEEYNTQEAESSQKGNHLSRLSVSMIDLQRSRSNSSVSDSQDFIAHSDTEMVTPMTTKRSSHHERRPRPPQHSSHHTPRLPHISKGHSALGYGLPSESLPVGYMPRDPWFVAVTDYDPKSIFSRSQRPEEELVLKEWDKVKVIGPLDETGYYLGEVQGRTGLVPADYLRPAEGRNGRWKGFMGEKLPPYLDASPERIVQTHYQMQQSHTPTHNGPLHVSPRMSESSPLSHKHSSKASDYPDPPKDFRVEKVIDQNTLLLAWTPPKLTNNRSVKYSGYKIYLNGHLHQQASSPHIAKAIVKNVDTRQYQGFSIQTVGAGGRGSELVQTVLNATVTGPRHEVPEETPSSVKNNEVYSSSQKRLFVAVYDFAPSPGKHGRLELPFLTGERIHVYGEERADGFYYGEINGRRGLVPCFFIQEVPQT
ncbi:uncharacterized protein LOC111136261 isoform X11 [Crassostrea virginica]